MGGRFLLVLLLALALGGWMFLRWLRRTPPEEVARVLRKGALWGAAGLLLLLVVTGRIHWLYGLVAGLLPLAQRVLALVRLAAMLRRLRGMVGGAGAAGAEAVTPFLRAVLDPAGRVVAAQVRAGRFAGRHLAELGPEELRALHEELAGDPEGRALLEAWLERVHGPGRRDGGRAVSGGGMTREEAYAVLGLEPGASAEEIRAAHRRLIQRLHPDRGGSDDLAARINRARAVLLGE
ncbi:J domain-containing protein [Inmirania thermothiophila]|uniref:DnaJ-like protein n=1 Tax=Inmirania thermothiophila TaxID=1750597 RepID=A0A3N1Y6Y1_9GAMM|nr:DnaJ domain-containing protein [Inmirania thermothiophila]ROR34576.1 DnaJ-like protein [Inmirania thermothiophila]